MLYPFILVHTCKFNVLFEIECRPDYYLVLKQRLDNDVSWADILLPCEYKKKDWNKDLVDISIQ